MALKNIDPTTTDAWKSLIKHFQDVEDINIVQLFRSDMFRKTNYTLALDALTFDYSKNKITEETCRLLLDLANQVNLKAAIEASFSGDLINHTENRPVLHTALRSNSDDEILVDGKDVKPKIKTALRKMRAFSNKVISGKWKGYTGKSITDVVSIGIGGSDLGPSMIVDSLMYYKNHLNIHFISNIDGDHLSESLKKINPETTLVIIVSKSFTTQETITNAELVKDWFLKEGSVFDVSKHFIAVSANAKSVADFGIDSKNLYPFWDWIGGRFSVWSSVGLSVMLAIGFDNFRLFLDGAEKMDTHFRTAKFNQNIPVMMALLGVWYNNFHQTETEAVISYTHYLSKFSSYLQQLVMESNGKSIDRDGKPVTYQTSPIIWGGVGTNMQHTFMQLVHQGTKIVPVDFIGFREGLHQQVTSHNKLMANFYGQIDALAFGNPKEQVHLSMKLSGNKAAINRLLPYRVFEGNRPSNCLLFDKLTPETLGMLLATYEHKVFVQGVIWNINSFDQFGVELGKELAGKNLSNKLF